jgi:hypothetical protein
MGLGKLGRVAIDSTRIKANASRDRVDSEPQLRQQRAKLRRQVRRWQKACDRDDSEPGGLRVALAAAEQQLAEMPRRLQQLRKSGLQKRSRSDEEARFLRQRGGRFELGYTAEIAVSDDHLIVAQRVTQNATDNASLLPMVAEVKRQCGSPPGQVLADSGYFSLENLRQLEQQKVEGYVPDSNLARALNLGKRCRGRARARVHRRMRKRLRSAAGRAAYGRRKAVVEPVLGVLKEQRGMRQFRLRGKPKVGAEFTLATLGYNLTRMYAAQSGGGTISL